MFCGGESRKTVPHFLHIACQCGHRSDGIPWSANGFDRSDVLSRARCTACGQRRAVDVVAYFSPEVHPVQEAPFE